jgi:NAD(P)-dependent dehydrogenase (short-subunit alcohol dehydrogenase family)
MALRLAQSGVDVILTYHSKEAEAKEVVAEIEKTGSHARALQLDVSDPSSLDAFLKQVSKVLKDHWNRDKFDFLVNNAGVGATIPIAEAREEDFDRLMNIHFKSVYFLTQKALLMMNDQGRIINISTGSTRYCIPGYSIYASMKGAIETFTRYLAKEVGSRGITANVVAPGAIETDFNNAAIRNNPQLKTVLAAQTALGRVGEANDIGGVVAFLCSENAGWVNAQRIEVSGGMFL